MAEFAAAALASVAAVTAEAAPVAASLGGAAATGAAAATTGASIFSSLAGAGSIVSSILAGGATVASVLNQQRAGEQRAQNLELQATDAQLNSRIEATQGLERRVSLKQSLVQTLGERDVATAASGVDLSFGTPTIARQQAVTDAERALAIDSNTEELRRARLLERAGNFRLMASQAREGTLATSAVTALEGGARLLRRG